MEALTKTLFIPTPEVVAVVVATILLLELWIARKS